MFLGSKSKSRFWLMCLRTGSVAFLSTGFVLVVKSTLEIASIRHVTTNSLSWSSGWLLLLLIGSLTNSCCKGEKPALPTSVKSKG